MSDGRYERELVNALDRLGYAAMRAPSSGSATERDLPDVLAMRNVGNGPVATGADNPTFAEVWAIEHKTTKGTTAYVDRDEVEDLVRFAEVAGAIPLLSAKFKRPGKRSRFWLVRPQRARPTPEGNYGLPESDVAVRAFARVDPPTPTREASISFTPGSGAGDAVEVYGEPEVDHE